MERIHGAFFSNCSKMEKIKVIIGEVANIDVPILIRGESGTGKEVVAQSIHLKSYRRRKPLIKVDCANIPKTLLESELFGFEKSAFGGARLKKPGRLELANGGTIILDNIGDIDTSTQAKLLQFLQEGGFSRLGGGGDIRVNARIITTTKDDLEKCISRGNFREDLFSRINVISITVPPLRERKGQILPLAQYFLDIHRKKFRKSAPYPSARTVEFFKDYDWPGNIRELESLIKRIILFGEEEVMSGLLLRLPRKSSALLFAQPLQNNGQDHGYPEMRSLPLRRIGKEAAEVAEREFIRKALQETQWNRKEAAKILQVSYKALLNKIKKYRLDELKDPKNLMEELEWPTQANHL
jgi:two-component system response regulator AtoC